MQFILKNIVKFGPIVSSIIVLIIIQLLFIGINIIGIVLFARLFIYKETYKIIIAVTFASLIYDSVKMIPLGAWSLSFYVVSLPILGILNILKIQSESALSSWPTALVQIIIVSMATVAQAYVLMRISSQHTFDFNVAYSIVALSTLYILFLKLTHKKERRLLLD